MTTQDKEILRHWVDPHQLKQINGRWEKLGREVITAGKEMRWQIIWNHHDLPTYGHPGIQKTIDLVQQTHWWPTLKKDVVEYIKGCGECQQNKVNTKPGDRKSVV